VYEAMLGSRNTRLTLMLFWCSVELSGDSLCRELEKPSLYDRLGGVYGIATVVDDFIDRTWSTPTKRQSSGG
jgi:hypothetical protein